MVFGFPARFTESRTLNLPQDEFLSLVKAALENLGLSYELLHGNEFVASVHNSPFTFGEELSVEILANGLLRVQSKCVRGGMYRMPQIFDFGANRKNVDAFFNQLKQTEESRGAL